MSGSDVFGVIWVTCGLPGGLAFAWSNRHLDERPFDRALTAVWSVGICALLGVLALPILFDRSTWTPEEDARP